MNRVIFFLWLLLLTCNAVGQTYALRIEFLNASKPAALFEIILNGHRMKANTEGMIYYTRNTGSNNISISMADADYLVAGPSTISYPENQESITTIVLHKKTNIEQAYSSYVKTLNKLNIAIGQSNKQIDSVLKIVTGKYQISESDLRNATEILNGRDKYFKSITYALEGYLNEAKDIRDIFKNMLSFSLENPRSFVLFDSTIAVYNSFYSLLNNNSNEYEKGVETYWHSPELAMGFHNVFDYAINTIHRSTILNLNTQVNQKANEYIHEQNKKRRKELKTEIIATLNTIVPVLDNNLVVLENKVKYHIGKLEANREIITD
jgi:hypothetical protein